MNRCPHCRNDLTPEDGLTCRACGRQLLAGEARPSHAEILAQDSWEMDGDKQRTEDYEPAEPGALYPTKTSDAPAGPSGAGYGERRPSRNPRFDVTVGLSTIPSSIPPGPYAVPMSTPATPLPQHSTPPLPISVMPPPPALPRSSYNAPDSETAYDEDRPSAPRARPSVIPRKPTARPSIPALQETRELTVSEPPRSATDIASSIRDSLQDTGARLMAEMRTGPSVDVRFNTPSAGSASFDSAAIIDQLPRRDASGAVRLDQTGRALLSGPWLGFAAFALLSLWFVPDAMTAIPVFPQHALAGARGIKLLALIAEPIAGALLFALLLMPMSPSFRASLAAPIGLFALAVPLLAGDPVLAIDGKIVLTAAALGSVSATVAFALLQSRKIGHFTMALVPLLLLGTAVYGVLARNYPAAHLAVWKEPLQIYASMLVFSMGLATFLVRPAQGRRGSV